jgi:hypothetical protein
MQEETAGDVIEMPELPYELIGEQVNLVSVGITPGDREKGYVPAYRFKIVSKAGIEVGHINLPPLAPRANVRPTSMGGVGSRELLDGAFGTAQSHKAGDIQSIRAMTQIAPPDLSCRQVLDNAKARQVQYPRYFLRIQEGLHRFSSAGAPLIEQFE